MATKKATGTTKQNMTPEQWIRWYVSRLEKEQPAGPFVKSEHADSVKGVKDCVADVLFQAETHGAKAVAKVRKDLQDNAFQKTPHRTFRTFASLELTSHISSLSALPGDREVSSARKTALVTSFRRTLLPFHWIVALVANPAKGAPDVIRLNGNHSSRILIEQYHYLTAPPEVQLTVFYVDSQVEAVRVFQSLDLRQSMRNLRDLLYVEYHNVPALAPHPIKAALLSAFAAGLCFEHKWFRWDQILPQEKIPYVKDYADFINWARNVFAGYKLGSGEDGVKKFLSAPVVAALYRAWLYVQHPPAGAKKNLGGPVRLLAIFQRAMSTPPPTVSNKPAVMLVDAGNISKLDPEVQLNYFLSTKYLNVSRCIDKINQLTAYDTMYYITSQALFNAIHGIRGDITNTTSSPFGKAFGA